MRTLTMSVASSPVRLPRLFEDMKRRAGNMPNRSGPWGKFIASIITLGIGISVLIDPDDAGLQGGIRTGVDVFGGVATGAAFVVAAIGPMVGVLLAPLWLRTITTGFALTLWWAVLFSMLGEADVHIRQLFTAIACIACYINAEIQLARRVKRERRSYGGSGD